MLFKTKKIEDGRYKYRGYVIFKKDVVTSGRLVLGGRHWTQGGIYKRWFIKKPDGNVCGFYYDTMKSAKKDIDEKEGNNG